VCSGAAGRRQSERIGALVDPWDYEAGAGITLAPHIALDFHELTKYFPVALVGEYNFDYDFSDSEDAHTITGGVYYSGRRDFDIGLVGGAALAQPGDDGPKMFFGQMMMQYFF